jgi:hypothetical protein
MGRFLIARISSRNGRFDVVKRTSECLERSQRQAHLNLVLGGLINDILLTLEDCYMDGVQPKVAHSSSEHFLRVLTEVS